jgi:hypothetical protein
MEIITQIETKYRVLQEYMDERTRRIWAAAEARIIGRGWALPLLHFVDSIVDTDLQNGFAGKEGELTNQNI